MLRKRKLFNIYPAIYIDHGIQFDDEASIEMIKWFSSLSHSSQKHFKPTLQYNLIEKSQKVVIFSQI